MVYLYIYSFGQRCTVQVQDRTNRKLRLQLNLSNWGDHDMHAVVPTPQSYSEGRMSEVGYLVEVNKPLGFIWIRHWWSNARWWWKVRKKKNTFYPFKHWKWIKTSFCGFYGQNSILLCCKLDSLCCSCSAYIFVSSTEKAVALYFIKSQDIKPADLKKYECKERHSNNLQCMRWVWWGKYVDLNQYNCAESELGPNISIRQEEKSSDVT